MGLQTETKREQLSNFIDDDKTGTVRIIYKDEL